MKAIILLSGGIDSSVVLALALEQKRECETISFDYGQRHLVELQSAKKIADHYGVNNLMIPISNSIFDKSSLVKLKLQPPEDRTVDEIAQAGIPNTYVPARNTLFLAYATAFAEITDAKEIWAGPNLLDQAPYPDCRPAFYQAFQQVLNVATKQAIVGSAPQLRTPLIEMDKSAIGTEARRLKVPLELTFSCYAPTLQQKPCQRCDACKLRELVF